MRRWWALVASYLVIATGTLVTALGINLFLAPFRIADGGVVGAAIVLYHTLGVPLSLSIVALNLPILALAWWTLGAGFVLRTLYGVLALAFFTRVTGGLDTLTGNPLLAAVYGGVISGAGTGLALRAGGSLGGSDCLGRALNKLFRWRVGNVVLVSDLVVITAAAVVFGAELALYGALSLFVATRLIDLLVEGVGAARVVLVITTQPDPICLAILRDLQRGATVLQGRGAYTSVPRSLVYTVVGRDQLPRLREVIRAVDPSAFVVVTDAHEVMGEGFSD